MYMVSECSQSFLLQGILLIIPCHFNSIVRYIGNSKIETDDKFKPCIDLKLKAVAKLWQHCTCSMKLNSGQFIGIAAVKGLQRLPKEAIMDTRERRRGTIHVQLYLFGSIGLEKEDEELFTYNCIRECPKSRRIFDLFYF